jgi:hypothetical protein
VHAQHTSTTPALVLLLVLVLLLLLAGAQDCAHRHHTQGAALAGCAG